MRLTMKAGKSSETATCLPSLPTNFLAVGGGSEARDRDRGRIGGDDRLGLQHGAELVEDLALDLFLFDRGLDDEIAIGEVVELFGGRDARQRRGLGLLG